MDIYLEKQGCVMRVKRLTNKMCEVILIEQDFRGNCALIISKKSSSADRMLSFYTRELERSKQYSKSSKEAFNKQLNKINEKLS